MNIKQFKLTNNDEIVCEVQSWPDEDTDEIIIKKALKITPTTSERAWEAKRLGVKNRLIISKVPPNPPTIIGRIRNTLFWSY